MPDSAMQAPLRLRALVFYGIVLLLAATGMLIGVTLGSRGVTAKDLQERLVEVRRDNCQETNLRNRNTIVALDVLLDRAVRENPARKDEIEQSRASTVLLINALVPVRDCGAYANALAE